MIALEELSDTRYTKSNGIFYYELMQVLATQKAPVGF